MTDATHHPIRTRAEIVKDLPAPSGQTAAHYGQAMLEVLLDLRDALERAYPTPPPPPQAKQTVMGQPVTAQHVQTTAGHQAAPGPQPPKH